MHGEQGIKAVHKKKCIWLKLEAKDAQFFFESKGSLQAGSLVRCYINNDYDHYFVKIWG